MYSPSAPLRVATLLCLLLAAPAFAAWELDDSRSTLRFMSVKNGSTGEVHHFSSLSGELSDDGTAQLRIPLDSVETLIPIRNERMREMLFETMRFPAATLSARVPASLLERDAGDSTVADLEITVQLHGASKPYTASVLVTGLADGSVQVVLREPLVVNAADFGLVGGIEALREVAGLASIGTAVPVTAHLVFAPQ